MYVSYNANPDNSRVDDCVIRAISTATDKSWEETYIGVCLYGLMLHDMPSANHVWGDYLEANGFERSVIPNRKYTVRDFAREHKQGTYILAISGHVVACVDGDYYDTWDSGDCIPVYFWRMKQ